MFADSPRRAFSLLELIVIIIVIGIVGLVAVPRLSRATEHATDLGLVDDLTALRTAIRAYRADHGGRAPSLEHFADQLTLFSDVTGTTSVSLTPIHLFGPYLDAIPPLGVGEERGGNRVGAEPARGIAWVYDPDTAVIRANTGELADSRGVMFSTY